MKNILLVYGGGGTEHAISKVSSKYIEETLKSLKNYRVLYVEMMADGNFILNLESETFQLQLHRPFNTKKCCAHIIDSKGALYEKVELDLAIPCIHGPPGETGDIQSLFEFFSLPYIGCGPEASKICFNKVSSKLWFNALGIPNTPFMFLSSMDRIDEVYTFFKNSGEEVFIKAASQGSSVGCYYVNDASQIEEKLREAFKFSSYVLIERKIVGRELEISAYEYRGEVHTTVPGEIICPSQFYSFEEKYNQKSQTTTTIEAQGLKQAEIDRLRSIAKQAFTQLKLRHLSRVDFFFTQKGDIYLNEINTFPGMTPISMFPKMMEHGGLPFAQFLEDIISSTLLEK